MNIDRLVADHGLGKRAVHVAGAPRRAGLRRAARPARSRWPRPSAICPSFVDRVDELLAKHGICEDIPLTVRITGCPNGCARPYLAEIALIGRAPGRYTLRLGADAVGQRLNVVYRDNIDEASIVTALDELIGRYATRAPRGRALRRFPVARERAQGGVARVSEAVATLCRRVSRDAGRPGGCAASRRTPRSSWRPTPDAIGASTTGWRRWTPKRACAGRSPICPARSRCRRASARRRRCRCISWRRQDPSIPVILIDTGYLFPETYQFIEQLRNSSALEHPDVLRPADRRGVRGAARQAVGAGPRRPRPVSRAAQGGADAARAATLGTQTRGSPACAAARPRAARS